MSSYINTSTLTAPSPNQPYSQSERRSERLITARYTYCQADNVPKLFPTADGASLLRPQDGTHNRAPAVELPSLSK